MAVIATLAVKLQAQIAEFQAEFKEAAKSTEKFQQEFQATATKASAYGNLIAKGIEIGGRALVEFGAAILENASAIKDLSQQTGLSMKTIQQFQYVAGQTGTTLEAFTNAATKLGTNLAGGGNSVVSAIEDLGLSFKELKQISPDEQFLQIADALFKMEDKQERNRVSLVLFGRTFKELMPAMEAGYRRLAEAAKFSSDEQLNALSDAEDAWQRFKDVSVTAATSWAGNIIIAFEKADKATLAWARGLHQARTVAEDFFELMQMQRDILAKPVPGLSSFRPSPFQGSNVVPGTADYKAVEDALNDSITRQNKIWQKKVDEYREAVKRLKDAHIPLTEAQKDFADEQLRVNGSISDIAKVLRISETAVRNYADATDDLAKDSLKAVGDAIKDVEQRIDDIGDAYERDLVHTLKAVADDIAFVEQKIIDSGEQFERDLTETMRFVVSEIEGVEERINNIEVDFSGIDWDERKRDFKDRLKNIALDGAHTFAEGVAEGIRTGDWGAVGQAFEDAMGQMMSGSMAAAVDYFVPGLGQALKPIFDAISKKITGLFDFNEGRDLVQDFAKSFGGFDALQAKLATLGDEGERLWRRLTQGVGRDNPAQARAAIDAVTAALGRQQEAFEALGARIGDLADIATGSGHLLDVAMIPFINQLRTAGAITDDVAAKLLGLTTDNSMNWREMQSLAEKYGIALSGLGATFQQQKLTETAGQIIRDFDRLIANGADYNAVLQGMSDEINAVVLESLKFGTEIPENMRPWIAELIATGRLLDGTGTKITDIDKLKFGPVIKSDVDKLVDAIKDLIDAIGTKMPAALTHLTRTAFPDIRIRVGFDIDPLPGRPGVPALAHGGIVRRPTLALIGEAGPEAVVPLSQLAQAGGTTQTIELHIGDQVTRHVVKNMPAELILHGI